jgi:hypothetical protein
MGLPVRHWEIQSHTVPEVFYDARWHMYDNSMSCLYTLCDGKTIAGTEDIGKTQGCAASGGKAEFGHIALYHCLNGTGVKGLLTGADCNRELHQEAICFNPNKIHNCNDLWWDRGHRYIFNLRAGESYTRYYRRLGEGNAYYTPNPHLGNRDPDHNPNYKIRGNGVRTWKPDLQDLAKSAHSTAGLKSIEPAPGSATARWAVPDKAGQPGHVIFKVEGANVITSLSIEADFRRRTADDVARIEVCPGPPARKQDYLNWKDVWQATGTGDESAQINLADTVNGQYEVLVKVELMGKSDAADAQLRGIEFKTVTQVNAKALPRLNIGKNIVYVGAGNPTESAVLWPELQGGRYQPYAVEEQNVAAEKEHPQVAAVLHPRKAKEEAFVVFRLDAPREITRITYGGRLYNKAEGSRVSYQHSFDNGKTWATSYTLDNNTPPWDVIQYVTIDEVPAKTRSALFRYSFNSAADDPKLVGLYAVRMEADYKPADEGFKPLEVTFTWNERQEDYSLVARSHSQRIERVPFRYEIDVGGADHPVMESLRVAAADADRTVPVKPGYSDGKDPGGRKYVPCWSTDGTNFAEGKSYTLSRPTTGGWDSKDPEGKKLTDGIAWCAYGGGAAYSYGITWDKPKGETITVDLGGSHNVGAFKIHLHGYPWFDALRGEMKDTVELLTSADNKTFASGGFFNLKLRWKDLPANFMWPDSERIEGHSFELILPKPVEARYVQYKITSGRLVGVTEVQALDTIKREPFDLRIALPDQKAPATQPALTSRSKTGD